MFVAELKNPIHQRPSTDGIFTVGDQLDPEGLSIFRYAQNLYSGFRRRDPVSHDLLMILFFELRRQKSKDIEGLLTIECLMLSCFSSHLISQFSTKANNDVIMPCRLVNIRPMDTNNDFFFHKLIDLFPHEKPLSEKSSTSHHVTESDDEFNVSIDLPGVQASDLAVTTHGDDTINIEGSRHRLHHDTTRPFKKSRITKSFSVDAQTVDLTQLKANLRDGVLLLSAPKKSKPEVRSISITTHSLPELPTVEKEPLSTATDKISEDIHTEVKTPDKEPAPNKDINKK